MKWNRCRRLPEVSLLAAGALGQAEKIELERHLAECQECRIYHAEIKGLVEPLEAWEKNLSGVEVTPVMQMRWEKGIKKAGRTNERLEYDSGQKVNAARLEPRPTTRMMDRVSRWMGIVWKELIRPSRSAWTGMAALWLAMLVINGNLSGHRAGDTGRDAASTQEMLRDWEEQNRVLAELSQPSFGFAAPVPPPSVLKPRSEREEGWKIV